VNSLLTRDVSLDNDKITVAPSIKLFLPSKIMPEILPVGTWATDVKDVTSKSNVFRKTFI
jgi:hypothetical protein